jgi:hypothetical protein
MTTEMILSLLRQRLGTIKERSAQNQRGKYMIEQEPYSHDREVEHWQASGELRAQLDERLFLAGLIEQLSEKAVPL